MENGAVGGQGIGGGARGGGNDEAVGPQVIDELPVNEEFEFDHFADGALIHHHVIQGLIDADILAVPAHHGGQYQTLIPGEAAFQQIFQATQHVVAADVGHKAQTPLIDPHQGHPEGGQLAGRIEHGTVSPQHNGQIRVLADGGEILHFPGQIAPHIAGRIALHHDHHAPLAQKTAQGTEGFGHLRTMVAPDQGNGPKSRGGADWGVMHGGN